MRSLNHLTPPTRYYLHHVAQTTNKTTSERQPSLSIPPQFNPIEPQHSENDVPHPNYKRTASFNCSKQHQTTTTCTHPNPSPVQNPTANQSIVVSSPRPASTTLRQSRRSREPPSNDERASRECTGIGSLPWRTVS